MIRLALEFTVVLDPDSGCLSDCNGTGKVTAG